jgi:hypothetical protein
MVLAPRQNLLSRKTIQRRCARASSWNTTTAVMAVIFVLRSGSWWATLIGAHRGDRLANRCCGSGSMDFSCRLCVGHRNLGFGASRGRFEAMPGIVRLRRLLVE